MCNRMSSGKGTMSPFSVNLIKIAVVLVIFCLAECAAGSCLNYGHACWGAHGKRNGSPLPQNPLRAEDTSGKDMKTKWFLSRLIQSPLDLRYSREKELDLNARQNPDSLFAENEVDNLNGQDWDNLQDIIAEDPMFDESIGRRNMDRNRLRSSKLVDKRSIKHN